MMWRDVVQLVSGTESINQYGDAISTDTLTSVFANRKSVRQSEFYQAHATGLKPELMFEVRSVDYGGQEKLVHNGKKYLVIRTHSKNDEVIELVVSGLVVS